MPCNINKRSWARPLSELRADTGLASDADLTALLVARHQGGTSLIWGCTVNEGRIWQQIALDQSKVVSVDEFATTGV